MPSYPRVGRLLWPLSLIVFRKTSQILFLPGLLQPEVTFSLPNLLWLAAELVKRYELVLNDQVLYVVRIQFSCLFHKRGFDH